MVKRASWLSALVGLMLVAASGFGAGPALAQSAGGGPGVTPPSSGWSPGPGASGSNTLTGALDQPSSGTSVGRGDSFTVSGWVVDTSAQGWSGIDQVQVWNGAMGAGGTELAGATVALNRPDVGQALGYPFWTASGFVANVPASANVLAMGPATLNLYAHTPSNGWWYRTFSFTVGTPSAVSAPAPAATSGGYPILAIQTPSSGEDVGVVTGNENGAFNITGYAFDPTANPTQGPGVDVVQVYINGERNNGGTLLGQVTPGISDGAASSAYGSQWADTGWSVTFTPTEWADGYTNVYVYARSIASRQWTEKSVGFTIVEGNGG